MVFDAIDNNRKVISDARVSQARGDLVYIDIAKMGGRRHAPEMQVALRICAAAAFLLAATVSATAAPPAERIVEAAATPDTLWIRYTSGSLVSYDFKSGSRSVLASGAADLTIDGSRILALLKSGDAYDVIDLRTGRRLAPPLLTGEGAMALVGGSEIIVLGRKSVFRLDRGKWISHSLDATLSWGLQVAAAATRTGRVYVGFNRGEWGGGLYLIDSRSGHVQEVRRVGTDPCHGPLAHECDPVTGIVPDSADPDCILASIGLAHMLSHGRVLRICGTKVDVLFSRAIPVRPGIFGAGNTWPLFGLAATPKGWAAISYRRLFRSTDGRMTEAQLPELTDWHGLRMAQIGNGLIALSTDINWTQSLSGPTPLLVPIQH